MRGASAALTPGGQGADIATGAPRADALAAPTARTTSGAIQSRRTGMSTSVSLWGARARRAYRRRPRAAPGCREATLAPGEAAAAM